MNKNKLAAATAILTGAISPNLANAALAAHNPHNKLTPKQQKLNRDVQRNVGSLVRRVINGPVDVHGGDSVSVTATGQKIDTRTVTVAAPNSSSTGTGEYSFSVTAPLSPAGRFESKKATAVVIAEGYQAAPDYSLTPVTSLEYVKNEQTGAWSIRGAYQKRKGIGTAAIEAAVKPELPREAHLTRDQLSHFTLQANDIVNDALNGAPVSVYDPAFDQPAHTQLNPLK